MLIGSLMQQVYLIRHDVLLKLLSRNKICEAFLFFNITYQIGCQVSRRWSLSTIVHWPIKSSGRLAYLFLRAQAVSSWDAPVVVEQAAGALSKLDGLEVEHCHEWSPRKETQQLQLFAHLKVPHDFKLTLGNQEMVYKKEEKKILS